jgi:hypothetical protein
MVLQREHTCEMSIGDLRDWYQPISSMWKSLVSSQVFLKTFIKTKSNLVWQSVNVEYFFRCALRRPDPRVFGFDPSQELLVFVQRFFDECIGGLETVHKDVAIFAVPIESVAYSPKLIREGGH